MDAIMRLLIIAAFVIPAVIAYRLVLPSIKQEIVYGKNNGIVLAHLFAAWLAAAIVAAIGFIGFTLAAIARWVMFG